MFNLDEVKRNAANDGIALSEIALIYDNLTDREMVILQEHLLVASGDGPKAVGRFTETGEAFFPEKIVGALYLGA